MTSKRASRWGSRPAETPAEAPVQPAAVSEEAALAALLADAQQAQEAKQPPQGDRQQQGGGRKPRDGPHTGAHGGGREQDGRRRDPSWEAAPGGEEGRAGKRRRRDRWNDAGGDDNPSNDRWGKQEPAEGAEPHTDDGKPKEKQKADFGLSGALATDQQTGNMYNGVLLKFREPPEARVPNTRWRLYVFRRSKGGSGGGDSSANEEPLDVLHISKQSAYLIGRERKVADIPVDHPSLSKQHAVIQFRSLPSPDDPTKLRCRPYLIDLGSTNGTFLNEVRLDEARYYEMRRGDVITLGMSSREYVLLTEQSAAISAGAGP